MYTLRQSMRLWLGLVIFASHLGLPAGRMDGNESDFVAALDKIQRAADANGLAVLGFAVTPKIL